MIDQLRKFLFIALILSTYVTGSHHHRHRRHVNLLHRQKRWSPHTINSGINPSGSIPGTSYYGVGSDPNYGSFVQRPNRPNGGILSISYNPNSNLNSYLINPSHSHQQYQQQSSDGYNRWQSSNRNSYAFQPGNRYAAGSAGWLATGGSYWYNGGESLLVKPLLHVISLMILIMRT